uniref:BCAR1 scaffold protein, Cas family member n=1 Tax=Balaenoptera musculus TaxID=9771 RepID=A0A8C0DW57_BALMU
CQGQNVLAKALYDNVAESPDELSFRKGDIMTVLERDTQGLDGWWLCSLHGRQGIVPGNRLKILVAVSTRVGQGYVFEAPQPEQDEYDIPRHLLAPGPQDIYDVPPVRGLLPSQYGQEVYDTPPMAVKGPNGRDPSLDVYDVPPSVEKGLPPSNHHAVYDVPPSVSKDVPDGPLLREETYDVPPAFAKAKPFDPTRHPLVLAAPPPDSPPAEDVYDVPPPAPDLYDVPPGLRRPGPGTLYDVPRDVADDGVYAVPPPAEREAPADAKRLSASSTGSTRSSQSASSLEAAVPGREPLELEVAVEALARLQQGVSATVAHLLDLAGSAGGCGGWRSTSEPQEPPAQDLRAAVAAVHGAVHELLEFARSAVGNAAHTSDRTLHAKLSRQLQKMEDVYQTLVAHGQTLDSSREAWGPLPKTGPPGGLLAGCARGCQAAGLLLAWQRGWPPAPQPHRQGGWMEDYDYVHLQGKEEFEKTQKELLEKGNIMRQGKGQLELQQLKQFERLEQEVSRPIDHDLANWMPAQPLAPGRTGGLGPSDRQLLLFYLEQCEANLTTLTNAVDAFFTAVATNQPPKIFVAHSKFVILSAHKLVFIGDTLSRQAKAADVRSQVTHYSNLLCDLLRGIVATTKAAALQYPSPAAAQDMVDRVKELGHSTQQFRRVLGQLAAA